jgi:6-phosphogluconolactonase
MPLFAFSGSLTRPAPNYGEANGKGLTSWRFDDATGALAEIATLKTIDDPNWLCVDATRRRLYAAGEDFATDQGWVAAFAIAADGTLTELNRQPTGGQTVCHMSLTPDRNFLLVANYNAVDGVNLPDGAARAFSIAADGSLGAVTATTHHAGKGPNADRQTHSHAHCVVTSPSGKFAYVADLGTDRIVVYALDAQGRMTAQPAGDLILPPGTGPRHLALSADGKMLFMVSELIATVFSASVNTETGALTQLDAFPIASRNGGIVQPSGILLTPDGRHIFAELRQADEIIGLAVDPATGKLTQTYRASSGGKTPRDFCFSLSGKYVLVANQDSDTISVFTVDYANGILSGPVQQIATGTPMAIAVANLPAT